MRISFILPFTGKTGGIMVALEHAERLAGFGHAVRVYVPVAPCPGFLGTRPLWKRPLAYLRALVSSILRGARAANWYKGGTEITRIPWLSRLFIEDADVVIATAWPTAYAVARLPRSKGSKVYFVQGYEIWSGTVRKVDGSYALPLAKITISPRLSEIMREQLGQPVAAEVHNGIDLDVFHPPVERRPGPLTVLMMNHELPLKGVADGLHVLKRLREVHPGIRFRLFGMPDFPEAEPWMEYVRNPSRERLVRLYQDADVFISPSLAEGWGLSPMEAMACGCAVVATRVGCVPVLERDGNLLAVEPGDRDGLFRHMDALLRDPDLRRETARKGLATMQEYSWDIKAREFEHALQRLVRDGREERDG